MSSESSPTSPAMDPQRLERMRDIVSPLSKLLRASSRRSHSPCNLTAQYGHRVCRLGSGSTSTAFLYEHPLTHRRVAVKRFDLRVPAGLQVKKVCNEFAIAASLHHPNICETIDVVFDHNHSYEIMEICEGGDLYTEALRYAPTNGEAYTGIPIQQAECIFKQLLRGLSYLHSHRIAHRDLKLENILFDAHNALKITDFGYAAFVQNIVDSTPKPCSGTCGSLPYMAPEVMEGGSYDGLKADMWSCGIIYVAMTTSHFPWSQADLSDPAYRAYLKSPGTSNSIPCLARTPKIIMDMLNPNPRLRPNVDDVLESGWMRPVTCCVDGLNNHRHGNNGG
ncbi:kinase-like domain-containing protein [Cladochytrium replicatum]|nr:kinase-like domain-containing protein [Cladochytrium replicatum]